MNYMIINSKLRINNGFTLIEVVLALGMITILSTIMVISLFSFKKRQGLDIEVKKITSAVREARDRALTQKETSQWGIRFENPLGDVKDFYKIVKGPDYVSGVVVSQTYLTSGLVFFSPADNSVTDIFFSKITGLPDAANSIRIGLSNGSASTTITIDAQGRVSF